MDEGTDCDDFGRTQQMSVSQLLSSTRRLLFVVMYFWQNIFLFQCEQHNRRPTERNKCLSALVVSFLTTADSSFLALIFQTNRNARQITAQPRGFSMEWTGMEATKCGGWINNRTNEWAIASSVGGWLGRQIGCLLGGVSRRFYLPPPVGFALPIIIHRSPVSWSCLFTRNLFFGQNINNNNNNSSGSTESSTMRYILNVCAFRLLPSTFSSSVVSFWYLCHNVL